ncbi:hypothetical protein FQZ97_1186670 [compost metagenome]
MGEIQRGDERTTHIGVGLARQGAEPGLHGVEVFDPRRQSLGVERGFDRPGLGRGPLFCRIQHRDRQGQIAEGAGLGSEHLESPVALL